MTLSQKKEILKELMEIRQRLASISQKFEEYSLNTDAKQTGNMLLQNALQTRAQTLQTLTSIAKILRDTSEHILKSMSD